MSLYPFPSRPQALRAIGKYAVGRLSAVALPSTVALPLADAA
jgi:hypothetical protein